MSKIRSYDQIVRAAQDAAKEENKPFTSPALRKKVKLKVASQRDAADIAVDEAVTSFEKAVLAASDDIPVHARALKVAEETYRFYKELYDALFVDYSDEDEAEMLKL